MIQSEAALCAAAEAGPVTPDQVRAGRTLLGWSRMRLALCTGTTAHIIKVYETTGRRVLLAPFRPDPVTAVRAALETAGVEFTNGGAPGVLLRKPAGTE